VDRMRPIALIAGFVVIVGLQALLINLFSSRWSLNDAFSLLGMTGTDQVRLFDAKYVIVAAGLIAIWCALFLERLDIGGMLKDPIVHIWILQMAAYVLMPAAIQFPQYRHPLAFISQRISLLNAVVMCAMLGRARYGRGITRGSGAVATIFFTFLYIDVHAYNTVEQKIGELAQQTPQDARFVAEISDSNSRLNMLLHAADWACIGHCYSYADYEPATRGFRVVAMGPNPVAAPDMPIVQDIEEGRHVVTAEEAPIYSVCKCGPDNPQLCLRRLEAGEKTCSFSLPITWGLPWLPASH